MLTQFNVRKFLICEFIFKMSFFKKISALVAFRGDNGCNPAFINFDAKVNISVCLEVDIQR